MAQSKWFNHLQKGDKSSSANYRPISLTCILCKMLEHIIASNLVKHLDSNQILYDLQQGRTLSWINAFLNGMSQTVILVGECSEEVPVTSGVPERSVLGQILFLICINDLPDKVKSQVRLFADDTATYLAITKLADSKQLQADLDIVQVWEITWGMQFNPSKCQVIHITRSRSPLSTKYTIHGETLEEVASARYLGVDIANDLSWKTHISRITKHCKQITRLPKKEP